MMTVTPLTCETLIMNNHEITMCTYGVAVKSSTVVVSNITVNTYSYFSANPVIVIDNVLLQDCQPITD